MQLHSAIYLFLVPIYIIYLFLYSTSVVALRVGLRTNKTRFELFSFSPIIFCQSTPFPMCLIGPPYTSSKQTMNELKDVSVFL